MSRHVKPKTDSNRRTMDKKPTKPGTIRKAATTFAACATMGLATLFGSGCEAPRRTMDEQPRMCFQPERELNCDETVSGEVLFGVDRHDTLLAGNLGVQIHGISGGSTGDAMRAHVVDATCNELFEFGLTDGGSQTFLIPNPDNPEEMISLNVSGNVDYENRSAHLTLTRTCERECSIPDYPVAECDEGVSGRLNVGEILILGDGFGLRNTGFEVVDGSLVPVLELLNGDCDVQGTIAIDGTESTVEIPNPANPDEQFVFALRLSEVSGLPEGAEEGDFVAEGFAHINASRICEEPCSVPEYPPLECTEELSERVNLGEPMSAGEFGLIPTSIELNDEYGFPAVHVDVVDGECNVLDSLEILWGSRLDDPNPEMELPYHVSVTDSSGIPEGLERTEEGWVHLNIRPVLPEEEPLACGGSITRTIIVGSAFSFGDLGIHLEAFEDHAGSTTAIADVVNSHCTISSRDRFGDGETRTYLSGFESYDVTASWIDAGGSTTFTVRHICD
jgi:hypothetical protein